MPHTPFAGLVPAVLTPFTPDGALNLAAVTKQAEWAARDGVAGVFVGGTTGESSSLTVEERLALAATWAAALKGGPVRLVVHVGANCLADGRALAAHARSAGAAAISMLSPSYLKPKSPQVLVECCREVAAAAPGTPFYFYDIPILTGVTFPVADWIDAAAERVPTLAGVKFTNPDLMTFQRLLHAGGGRLDILYGLDEQFLAAVALGGKGAVGSGYNFAAARFHRLLAAAARGDYAAARAEQLAAVRVIAVMIRAGYLPAAKEVMRLRGLDLGPVRLPLANLTPAEAAAFREELDTLGGPAHLWS
jgi:N-acetylneuraminate lyase